MTDHIGFYGDPIAAYCTGRRHHRLRLMGQSMREYALAGPPRDRQYADAGLRVMPARDPRFVTRMDGTVVSIRPLDEQNSKMGHARLTSDEWEIIQILRGEALTGCRHHTIVGFDHHTPEQKARVGLHYFWPYGSQFDGHAAATVAQAVKNYLDKFHPLSLRTRTDGQDYQYPRLRSTSRPPVGFL